MGLITVDPDDPMDNTYTGPQQMSLSEMTEFSREATLWGMGLIEWRLMGHTMVPVKQGANDGLDVDCSTWDELYADEDENAHPWTVPSAAKTPKNAATASQGSGADCDCSRPRRECPESWSGSCPPQECQCCDCQEVQ